MRFVVTGTGRSGTRWASEVLGVGHQYYFTGDGYCDWVGTVPPGDASFWAASEDRATLQDWRVILLVRDPRYVMASWLNTGEFNEGMIERGYLRLWQHCYRINPEIVTRWRPPIRLAYYWREVNLRLLSMADRVLKLEDTTAEQLAEACGVTEWTDVSPPLSSTEPVDITESAITSVAKEFGYDC